MSLAHLAQPGILEAIPPQARYLFCQLRLGALPQTTLQTLAKVTDGQSTVVGIGASLARALQTPVSGLTTFKGIEGALVKLPSTPVDLLVWLRGHDRGALLAHSRAIEAILAPAFTIEDITDAFNHDGGKDLTGYEDGTENPTGDEALTAALVPHSNGAPAGSSFLALQRWHHQFDRFEAMPRAQQDHTFGRERVSNEEMDDAPESAHVKRTAQEDFSPEAFVLRRSMPWAQDNQGGLVFTAFGHSFDAFEALLRRMSGAEDGIIDALFSFTEPQTGAYFWCPPMHQGRLDLRLLGL
ncbi:peroxidase [Hydrogenophaga crassostreae]|uniref:Peroxidase n=1 Tax=Hydrogenophaga crassostreae TaxID=1763535 RepID=A0A167IHI4_9BURK|nr:Dyp-type peroxidase [Hydrogenophaga crassostreae]AOW13092.1 peroxidase [Hydrogenophaga crassostreae]OAD42762.1 peroxidase [Hydrogenophaga crassostreae]